jgi:hypothetical protein
MFLIAGIALLTLPSTASAADHSLTAIAAGGLTEQPAIPEWVEQSRPK